ncbi:MAG: hypothetical protein F4Y39_11540 [Gemmatimonadetes bacterium]|nr:hypothetical protein [Gemmatimonadota bacterium]MYF73299.1 hypothetical protein [Gemmatimonadota bacterium]MYK54647.1 hypothetical protein [Gemmatimonadota bacterium]
MQIPTPQDKLSEMDARLARVEGIAEQMNTRLTSLETRVDNGFSNIDTRLTNMDTRNNSNFRWLIGLLVVVLLANVGTAVSIIMTFAKP